MKREFLRKRGYFDYAQHKYANGLRIAQRLKSRLMTGAQQLQKGDYTEYTDETLPELLGKIRSRGQNRLS